MKHLTIPLLLILILFCGAKSPVEPVSKVEWLTFEEAIKLHSKSPKKLLIDLYTDWCGWCKVMDRETYSHQQIADYINHNFYPVKFNAEQTESIEFDGHMFKYVPQGRRGVHELAATLTNNQLSYPTTVFMDEQLRVISPVPGYLKPKDMAPILEFIGEGYYKNQDFNSFKKHHKSFL